MTRTLTRSAALALLPLTLLLAGCFNLENRYVVNEDGSGSQTVRFAVPADTLTGLGEDLPDVAELESDEDIAELQSALGDMGEMRFFSSQEEGVGFELTVNVGPSDDFAAALKEQAAAIQAALPPEMADEFDMSMLDVAGDQLTLNREGDEWRFEIKAASLDPAALSALTGDPDMGMMANLFMGQTTILTSIRMPGEVVEHNADEVLEDGTLVWTQTGVATERSIFARSDVGGDGLSTMVQAGLAIVLVGVLLYTRSRRAA